MSKKTKKKLSWMLTLLVVTAGVLIWWKIGAKAEEKPKVETAEAVRGDLVEKVSATGSVEPEYIVEIKPKASGEIEKVMVQEGDGVKDGQLLMTIDPIVEKRRVNQARAELRMSQAGYTGIKHKRSHIAGKLNSELKLLEKGLVAKESVDTLQKELAVLKAEAALSGAKIQKAKEQLSEARDRLSETQIKSPVNGTVLERLVQPGQIVSSGTNSVSGGTVLLRIADLSRLFIRVEVDEADVAKVQPGMETLITADAFPGKEFGGHVLRISPQGKEENNVTVFEIVVQADEEGSKALRPNMTANVEIKVKERKDVVLLPRKFVRSLRGGRALVVDSAGNRKRIKLGMSDGIMVEVISGLQTGEKIVIPTQSKKRGGRSAKRGGKGDRGRGRDSSRNMRRMMGGRR